MHESLLGSLASSGLSNGDITKTGVVPETNDEWISITLRRLPRTRIPKRQPSACHSRHIESIDASTFRVVCYVDTTQLRFVNGPLQQAQHKHGSRFRLFSQSALPSPGGPCHVGPRLSSIDKMKGPPGWPEGQPGEVARASWGIGGRDANCRMLSSMRLGCSMTVLTGAIATRL